MRAETIDHFLFYCLLQVQFRASIRVFDLWYNGWRDMLFFDGRWSRSSKSIEEKIWKYNTEAVWAIIKYALVAWGKYHLPGE